MSELKYWVWLSTLRGLGAKDKRDLISGFGSPRGVYFAREWEYKEVINSDISPLLNKDTDVSDRILGICEQKGMTIMTLADGGYPERLRNIYDPPILLYVKGKLPVVDERLTIGIVGTRNCTPYGIMAAENMAYDIAMGGGVVVSGLAKGIDSAAALGALRGGGKVIGVLGCGIDVVYPASNRELYEDVSFNGALVSEYPPGTAPEGRNFPVRNRIISGLSAGVLVVEAPIKSGALITASAALEQGRDVFAVPGNIDAPSSRGTNELLREGAMITTSGRDILEYYVSNFNSIVMDREGGPLDKELAEKLVENQLKEGTIRGKDSKKVIDNQDSRGYIDLMMSRDSFSQDEIAVIEAIDGGPTFVDDIIFKSGIPSDQAVSILTMLEIKGYAAEESGRRYTTPVKLVDK